MFLKSLHIAGRQAFYLLTIITAIFLIGLIALAWLSAELTERKDEIAAWASEQIGYPVEFESTGIYLLDLIPKLEVNGLTISQPESVKPILQAKQVYLSLDLLATLQQQAPVIAEVSIGHVSLGLIRNEAGQFTVQGMAVKQNAEPLSTEQVMQKVSWLQQIDLTAIQVEYQDQLQPRLSGRYQLDNLQLIAEEDAWQLTSLLQLPAKLGADLSLNGTFSLDEDFHLTQANVDLLSSKLHFAQLLADQSFNGVAIEQGKSNFSAKLAYQGAADYQVDLDIELRDLLLRSVTKEQTVKLNYYKGQLSWQNQADSWSLTIPQQRLQFDQQFWPDSQFKLQQQADGQMLIQADYLNISDLTTLALLFDETPEFLQQSKPAGEISSVYAIYSEQAGLTQLSLNAAELGWLPWQSYPGINKASFKLNWQQGRANLQFDSHQTTLYAESWLTEPAYLESLSGEVTFEQQQDDWKAELNKLRLWNADFTIQADGFISQQQQTLDSQIKLDLQDVMVNRWKAYVPEHILEVDFKEWSAEAFVGGRIKHGVITMQGDPMAFPFDTEPEKGQFDMKLQAENVHLHYGPGWPDLKQVNGEVSGQGNNLLITSQSARIADMDVTDATVKISNLVRDKPVLTAVGKITGGSDKALAFLKDSPLEPRFGDIAEWLSLKGRTDIDLNLLVPLVFVDNTDVSGKITFVDTSLTTKAVDGLKAEKINGSLNFDNNGVTAETMKATVFGEPVAIKVVNKSPQTWVDITGKTSMRHIASLWPDVVPPFVTGRTSYLTRLIIAEDAPGDFGVEVDVKSKLKGITVNTPHPLAKVPAEETKFSLKITSLNNDELGYRLQYGDQLSAFFSFDKQQQMVGEWRLGKGRPTLRSDELVFVGRLNQFDADQWLDWQADQAESDSSIMSQLDQLDIEVNKLKLMDQNYDQVSVKAKQQKSKWQLDLAAQQFKGSVLWQGEAKPIQANFDYLNLQLPEDKETQESGSMSLWPSMALHIEQLNIDDMALGRLTVDAKRQGNQWLLNSASLSSPQYEAKLSGYWQRQQQDNSQFSLEVSSSDLKNMLKNFGYQEVIEAEQVQLKADLNWAGAPLALSRENTKGLLQLSVGRGQLLDVDPGTAGRIFGLFSVAALPRRLSLDFSDLFKKGFNFSAISSSFNLDQGIATTNDFVMNGDSAMIELQGPINLINETYAQTVKVTPEVSSTLPIAGAVAGGPVGLGVGTAILLVDKLAGKLFDKELVNVISYQYLLTGPWDDPQLEIKSAVQQ